MKHLYSLSAIHLYLRWRAAGQPDPFAADAEYLLHYSWNMAPSEEYEFRWPEARAPQASPAALKRWQRSFWRLRLSSMHPEALPYLPEPWRAPAAAQGGGGEEGEEEAPWETCLRLYLDALEGRFNEAGAAFAARYIGEETPLSEWLPAAFFLGLPQVYTAYVEARPALERSLSDTFFSFRVPFVATHVLASMFPPAGADAWGRMRSRMQRTLYEPAQSPDALDELWQEACALAAPLSGVEGVYAAPEIWYLAALMFTNSYWASLEQMRDTLVTPSLMRALACTERALPPETCRARFLFLTQVAWRRRALPTAPLSSVLDFLRPETPFAQASPALAAGYALLTTHRDWQNQPPVPMEPLMTLFYLSNMVPSMPLHPDLRGDT